MSASTPGRECPPPLADRVIGRGLAEQNGTSRPSRTIPAHVHFIVYAGDTRYSDMELRFEDDPLLSASERDRSTRDGEFGGVRPVRREGRTQHVDFRMRLDPRRRF